MGFPGHFHVLSNVRGVAFFSGRGPGSRGPSKRRFTADFSILWRIFVLVVVDVLTGSEEEDSGPFDGGPGTREGNSFTSRMENRLLVDSGVERGEGEREGGDGFPRETIVHGPGVELAEGRIFGLAARARAGAAELWARTVASSTRVLME